MIQTKALKGKDFISLMDYTKEELETILEVAFDLKRELARGQSHELLKNKTLGMIFCHPSTRTRVSFETGMTQLGGHAQYYDSEHLQTAHKETWADTASVLSRYIDGIMIRLYNLSYYGEAREILRAMADRASIPIINGLDDKEHPCQIMADLMAMEEKLGQAYRKKKVVMSWAYDERLKSAGVPQTMVIAASLLGMNLTLAYPRGYELDPEYMKFASEKSEHGGGTISIEHDIYEACRGASVIYAKSWKSSTLSSKEDKATREKIKNDWCISSKHFDETPQAVYMHCLPAHRGFEVTDEIIDGPRSIVWDQAENRLHVQKAILSLLLK